MLNGEDMIAHNSSENIKVELGLSNYATKTDLKSSVTEAEDKIDKIEKKIPDTSNLATKTELTSVKNKISSTDGFVKKN